VPENLKRYYGASDLHFITCSCYQRQPILGTPQRRDLFLSVLEQMRQAYRFVVLGYVAMPEHFHLLLSEPQLGAPSTVLQAVKIGFAGEYYLPTSRKKREKWGTPRWRWGTQRRGCTFGNVGSMTSTYGPKPSESRSCAISIAIR
jgi:REP element-mobilizing transposase RayT